MKRSKRGIGQIAKNFNLNPDDFLIVLWDRGERFDYLLNRNSVVKIKDFRAAQALARNLRDGNVNNAIQVVVRPIDNRQYDFASIGRVAGEIEFLTSDEVLTIHHELAKDPEFHDNPISPVGVKNEDLLESALFHPQTSLGGIYKFATIESAAAALMYALSNNHPFHNGNKRTSLVAGLVFLDRYNIGFNCSDDELFKIALAIAKHRLVKAVANPSVDHEIFELSKWIARNSRAMIAGERTVSKRKLNQILAGFDCKYDDASQCFERIIASGRFIRSERRLRYRLPLSTMKMGEDVDRGVIKSLRRDLELDREHGIDTEVFYGGYINTAGDFITRYKTVLTRLSRI